MNLREFKERVDVMCKRIEELGNVGGTLAGERLSEDSALFIGGRRLYFEHTEAVFGNLRSYGQQRCRKFD